MPAILYHFAFIEEIYRLSSNLPADKISFMAGNLIPDISAAEKGISHYRIPSTVRGFVAPDMERVRQDLFFPEDPIKFGMFTHLWLDRHFIEEVLIPAFIWDTENRIVINPKNGRSWSAEYFFSCDGMYNSYTEVNSFMIRDKLISIEEINRIPIDLPMTGFPVFDNRRKKTWRAQFEEHLNSHISYTGDIFEYPKLWYDIKALASKFVQEIL